ncbi:MULTISPECIES: hypothetical protein [Arthrobacter]|nr:MULTISPECIES: hypothetical protein [Arthrobacter]
MRETSKTPTEPLGAPRYTDVKDSLTRNDAGDPSGIADALVD